LRMGPDEVVPRVFATDANLYCDVAVASERKGSPAGMFSWRDMLSGTEGGRDDAVADWLAHAAAAIGQYAGRFHVKAMALGGENLRRASEPLIFSTGIQAFSGPLSSAYTSVFQGVAGLLGGMGVKEYFLLVDNGDQMFQRRFTHPWDIDPLRPLSQQVTFYGEVKPGGVYADGPTLFFYPADGRDPVDLSALHIDRLQRRP